MSKQISANSNWDWVFLIRGSSADNTGVMDEREGLIKWECSCSSQQQGGGGLGVGVDVTCTC